MSDHPHSQEDAFGGPPIADKPRFYFDTHDGERLIEDDTGRELDSVEAARLEVQRALADMIRDMPPDGNQKTIAVRVRDETGKTVIKAAISILVEVEP